MMLLELFTWSSIWLCFWLVDMSNIRCCKTTQHIQDSIMQTTYNYWNIMWDNMTMDDILNNAPHNCGIMLFWMVPCQINHKLQTMRDGHIYNHLEFVLRFVFLQFKKRDALTYAINCSSNPPWFKEGFEWNCKMNVNVLGNTFKSIWRHPYSNHHMIIDFVVCKIIKII